MKVKNTKHIVGSPRREENGTWVECTLIYKHYFIKCLKITGQYISRLLFHNAFIHLICHSEKLSSVILTDFAIAEITDRSSEMTTSELGGRKATDSHGIVRAWSYIQIEGRTRKQRGHFRNSQLHGHSPL